jgi:hypothetical protein
MEDINGFIGYTGDKPIGTGFMEGATVESRFKKGTNMSNYTRKLSAYYSSEDNPISPVAGDEVFEKIRKRFEK